MPRCYTRAFAFRRLVLALVLALLSGTVPASAQTYLVDTGSGGTTSIGAVSLFGSGSTTCSPQPGCASDFQYLGARIQLSQAATVTGVELWVVPFSFGGDLTVRIREEVSGLPGANAPPLFSANSIYAKTFPSAPNVFGSPQWVAFNGMDAVLAAGTYWITLEPAAGTNMNYSLPGGAPNALSKYAFYSFGNPGYVQLPNALGIRVAGSYFPGVAFGTATRLTASGGFATCCGPVHDDIVQEGTRAFTWFGNDGPALTSSYLFPIGSANVHGRGRLIENGLTAGAYAQTNSLTQASGRGIAYRTFVNLGSTPRTFRLNADLHGAKGPNGGTARGGIYAFDTAMFTAALQAALPTTPGHYLLDADGYVEVRDTLSVDSIRLDRFFPPAALLARDIQLSTIPLNSSGSVSMQTGLMTLQPGAAMTVLFDVAVAAGPGGSVNFGNTLAPAADFFTDTNGVPVYDVVGIGPAAPVATPSSLTSSPAVSTTAVGTTRAVTVTALTGSLPAADVDITMTIVSGPNAGLVATGRTDTNGEAVLSYLGTTLGTDTIHVTASALAAADITTTWVPGAAQSVTVSPSTASVIAGTSQSYVVTAFDVFGNSLGDVTASATLQITPDGTCGVGACTPAAAGTHTVTATYGALAAQAALTVSPASQPSPRDVSAQVGITYGGFTLVRSTGRWVHTLTLRNNGVTTVTGPISVVLSGLSTNASVFHPTGTTTVFYAGSRYVNLAASSLAPGATATLTLEFTKTGTAAIAYVGKVVAGQGTR